MILLQDVLSEQLTIGLMLSNEEALNRGLSELGEDYFSDPNFQMIFRVMGNLNTQNRQIDLYSLKGELDKLNVSVSLDDITSMEDRFYISEKFNSLIENLTEAYKRRKTLTNTKLLIDKLKNDTTPYDTLITQYGDVVSDLEVQDESIVNQNNFLEFRQKSIEYRANLKPLLFGYETLDELITYKLPPGEVSIIAARPSNGKSAFKANVIRNLCMAGHGVGSFALEQTKEVEMDRMDAIDTNIPIQAIATVHKWSKQDPRHERLKESWERQRQWNYHLLEGNGKSLKQLYSIFKRLKKDGVEILFFDLFDRLDEIGTAVANKPQRVSSALVRMLQYAKDLQMHICLLSQINRTSTKRKDLRPKLEDLKDSGGYEEVGRLIMLLHYPQHYDHSIASSIVELDVAKQANGPCKTVEIDFNNLSLRMSSINIKKVEYKKVGKANEIKQ